MKICLVNALFHPFSGGVEKHMYELSRELVSQSVDVTMVTARIEGTPAYEVIDGVKVYRVPCISLKVPGLYPPPLIISPLFVHYLREARQGERLRHHSPAEQVLRGLRYGRACMLAWLTSPS